MSITVLGGGAFGTALAIAMGDVTLWARDVGDMAARRENTARLPGCPFPDALRLESDLASACAADTILIAVPMQQLRPVLETHSDLLDGKQIVACCKGMEIATGDGPVTIIRQTLPHATAAILTGPSFAADIARGLPTALTLACADEAAGKALQSQLSTQALRLYRTTDTTGAELGGALKNVIAIACGAAMGAGLGESARAALMTRGYAEMGRLAEHLGGKRETLAGLAGFGDLALTCTSEQSRNYRFGLSIGKGQSFDSAITVEGAATARAIDGLAERKGIDMPITRAVAALINGKLDVTTAMRQLLTRPLKEE